MARKRSAVFSLYDIDKLLKKAGAERICEKASLKLAEILEDSAKALLFKARIYARHAGRNYVTPEDIRLATNVATSNSSKRS